MGVRHIRASTPFEGMNFEQIQNPSEQKSDHMLLPGMSQEDQDNAEFDPFKVQKKKQRCRVAGLMSTTTANRKTKKLNEEYFAANDERALAPGFSVGRGNVISDPVTGKYTDYFKNTLSKEHDFEPSVAGLLSFDYNDLPFRNYNELARDSEKQLERDRQLKIKQKSQQYSDASLIYFNKARLGNKHIDYIQKMREERGDGMLKGYNMQWN